MEDPSQLRAGHNPALPTLLLLADGRFPAGGHAHSGGLEAAVQLEGIQDVPDLAEFLRGRLATAGAVTAAFASAACAATQDVDEATGLLDALGCLGRELDARTPSPTLRTVSRRLGRQLLRAGPGRVALLPPRARREGVG